MTKPARRPSLRKRYPGRFAARLIISTPAGSEIEFEVGLPREYARQLQSDFIHLLDGKDPKVEGNVFGEGRQPLYRHAGIMSRHGERYTFTATSMVAHLTTEETSPFHDLPQDAHVYIEVGVDMEATEKQQPQVFETVKASLKNERRSILGPPIKIEPESKS